MKGSFMHVFWNNTLLCRVLCAQAVASRLLRKSPRGAGRAPRKRGPDGGPS